LAYPFRESTPSGVSSAQRAIALVFYRPFRPLASEKPGLLRKPANSSAGGLLSAGFWGVAVAVLAGGADCKAARSSSSAYPLCPRWCKNSRNLETSAVLPRGFSECWASFNADRSSLCGRSAASVWPRCRKNSRNRETSLIVGNLVIGPPEWARIASTERYVSLHATLAGRFQDLEKRLVQCARQPGIGLIESPQD
jgi:hypothetical protein